jgi:multidrug efflux system membrane fusion protein
MRTVKPGVTHDNVTQVEGINPGDVVADSSFDKLRSNIKVVISKTPASGAASGSGSQ